MSDKTHTRGRFVWHELLTPDVEASKAFYRELFGWTFEDYPMAEGKGVYPTAKKGDQGVAGVLSLDFIGKDDVPPCWISYVSIANIDESAAAIDKLGGTVVNAPSDIPGVGRFTTFADPQNAHLNLIDFEGGDPPAQERPGVGTFCWEQLSTTDVQGAVAFYQKICGWDTQTFAAMGNMTTFHAGPAPVASVMPAPEGVPPHWMTYVVVENLVASRDLAIKRGATVLLEAVAMPGIGQLSVIRDPQGAVIGIFQGDDA